MGKDYHTMTTGLFEKKSYFFNVFGSGGCTLFLF